MPLFDFILFALGFVSARQQAINRQQKQTQARIQEELERRRLETIAQPQVPTGR